MPKTQNLHTQVEKWIRSPEHPAGASLPSIRTLAEQFGVGRTAMGNAVKALLCQGIVKQKGRFYFKAEEKLSSVSLDDESPVVDLFIHRTMSTPSLDGLRRLGIRPRINFFKNEEELQSTLNFALTAGTDGVVMMRKTYEAILQRLENKGVPVIIYGERWEGHSFVSASMLKLADQAVAHLAKGGHREIAYLSLPEGLDFLENRDRLKAALPDTYRHHGLNPEQQHLHILNGEGRPEVLTGLQEIQARTPGVTAMICETIALGMQAIKMAPRCGWKVPETLSILCLQEHPCAKSAEPPLTTLGVEMDLMFQMAVNLICNEIAHRKKQPFHRRTYAITCEPTMIRRASTAAAIGKDTHTEKVYEEKDPKLRWSISAKNRHEKVRKMNQQVFTFDDQKTIEFTPVKLPLKQGRSLSRQNAWLGKDPLRFFTPGKYVIHGIRYQVKDRAIIPASAMARCMHRKPLPEEFWIPVARSVAGICILHAAGWVVYGEAFAEYIFCFAKHEPVIVPVTPFPDKEHRGTKAQPAKIKTPLLQDWHPSFRQNHGKNVLPYVVTENGDPLLYERYLYSYRWQNPYPKDEVTGIRVRSLNTERRTTLAVLAVTTYGDGTAHPKEGH